MMATIEEIIDETRFDSVLKEAGESKRLVVVFFWAEFHEPSKRGGQMDTTFTALAAKNKNVVFLKV